MAFELILKIFFIVFSVVIAILDIRKGEIPRITFILAFLILFTLRVVQDTTLWLFTAGAADGLAVFLLAFFISKKKLGLADVWYSGIIGFVLGHWHWYIAISASCILGIMYILIFKKQKIPFIPFMATGGVAICIIKG